MVCMFWLIAIPPTQESHFIFDTDLFRARLSLHWFHRFQYDLHRRLKGVLADHKVSIPYPHRVVHHVGQASTQSFFDKT